MSRPLRIDYPDAWYHVMNRGRRGEKIFSNKTDDTTFLELLMESAEMWNARIAAFKRETYVSTLRISECGFRIENAEKSERQSNNFT